MCEIEARVGWLDDDVQVVWNSTGFYYVYVEVVAMNFSDYFDREQFDADVRAEIRAVDSVVSVLYEGELEVCIDDSYEE
jgi:hypothetical protein